ncbi:hypothetical protein K7432_018067 [Basidiobolus ranarum]|uniref:Uncharacterized protein n=1 Tax=Basidiobolus ranarum TaxID=34480 RepID=A0ABR2WCL4_9FUNG
MSIDTIILSLKIDHENPTEGFRMLNWKIKVTTVPHADMGEDIVVLNLKTDPHPDTGEGTVALN